MSNSCLTFLAGFVASLILSSAVSGAETMRLLIGEEVYEVPVGEPFAVAINGERVRMQLDSQESFTLEVSGIEFAYPSDLKLEENAEDGAVKIWTMQGENAALMLQEYAAEIGPESLLEALVANILDQHLEEAKPKRRKVRLNGTDRTLEGAQIETTEEGVVVLQNLFTFENEQGVFALMLQDAHAEDAEASDEYKRALHLLGESLAVGPEPEEPEEEIIEELPAKEGDNDEADGTAEATDEE